MGCEGVWGKRVREHEVTLFCGSPMPKSVQECSTNMSYSRNDPASNSTLTRSLAVSFPCSNRIYTVKKELYLQG